MFQVFFPVEYNISFHKEANVIPIRASLILVILLSCTYYLPSEAKNRMRGNVRWSARLWVCHCHWGISLMNWLCKNTVWITLKLPSVFICQAVLCWFAARTGASSNYFREILSIAECETAWASHVCPVKIQNGPICSSLIRFLPAETAIIFLSLGFSCGPVVLQSPLAQSRANLVRKDGIHVWYVLLQLLYERRV